jgi:hypothetical protein
MGAPRITSVHAGGIAQRHRQSASKSKDGCPRPRKGRRDDDSHRHYSGRFRNQLWLAGWEYPKHLGWRPGTWRVSCVWRVPGLECLQRGGAWTTASLSPRWEGHRWPTAAATVQTRSLVEGAIGDRQSRPAANEICRELRQSWPAGLERYRTRSLLGEEGGQHAWQYSRHGPRDVRRTGREG